MKRILNQFIITIVMVALIGCSWQGQRHQQYENGQLSVNSEWWSMRFLWVSSGVEAYTKTPFFETGSSLSQSQSDKEAIKDLTESISKMLDKLPPLPQP